MKFTGHERDRMDVSHPAGDLDYMHARYYSGDMGRFLSVDPKNRFEPLRASQLWSRYAYAIGNPLGYVDPNGETPLKSYGLGVKGYLFFQTLKSTLGFKPSVSAGK